MTTLRKLIKTDIRYKREIVYFMLLFPTFMEKVVIWFNLKDKKLNKYDTLTDIEKRKWIQIVLVPEIEKNEPSLFTTGYNYLYLNKYGRQYLKYLKYNEPEKL